MTLDSQYSPWPELNPYSILWFCPRHLHLNGFLSRDSQGGVLKLSRFGLLGLCKLITFCSNLWLEWGLKQTSSSLWELSNNLLHSTCTRQGQVNSWLLVVGSQIASLIFDLFFAITCAENVQMAHARPFSTSTLRYIFNDINNVSRRGVWPLQSNFEVLRVPEDSQDPILGVWVSSSHSSKSGVAACHLSKDNNYRRIEITFVERRCKDKATNTINSNPQGWILEYGGKSKVDGVSNARTRKWTSFLEGSGWTSSTNSLPWPRGAYGKNKQTLEWSRYSSN